MNNYGKKLKEVRQDKDIKQKEIAKELNTTIQQVSKYETGLQIMSAEVLKRWCLILKVSADYILDIPNGLYDPR